MSDLEEYLRNNGVPVKPTYGRGVIQQFGAHGVHSLYALICNINIYRFNGIQKYFNDEFHLLLIIL